MDALSELIYKAVDLIGIYGPILSCFLIIIESMFPILPLGLFITLNFLSFGNMIGFLMSWIFTIAGCLLSYFIFKKGVQCWFNRLIENKDKLNNLMLKFNNISVTELAIIIAIPFTPAFLINIAAGLSDMKFNKFFVSLLVGKLGLVYFWGYIGTNIVESLKNPIILIKVIIILLITYIISIILKKALKL